MFWKIQEYGEIDQLQKETDGIDCDNEGAVWGNDAVKDPEYTVYHGSNVRIWLELLHCFVLANSVKRRATKHKKKKHNLSVINIAVSRIAEAEDQLACVKSKQCIVEDEVIN